MAGEFRGRANPTLAPFYFRAVDAATGFKANNTSQQFEEYNDAVASQYAITATQGEATDEWIGDRPGWIDDRALIVELVRRVGGSPAGADRVMCERDLDNSVEDALDAIAALQATVDDIETAVTADLFTAETYFLRDETEDDYGVQWRRGTAPLSSGITGSPTIEVEQLDGTVLIAQTAMTLVSTGRYRYTTTTRATLGDPVWVTYRATIDSVVRTWRVLEGRDYAA